MKRCSVYSACIQDTSYTAAAYQCLYGYVNLHSWGIALVPIFWCCCNVWRKYRKTFLSLTELKIFLKYLWTLVSFLWTSICSCCATPIPDSICSSKLALGSQVKQGQLRSWGCAQEVLGSPGSWWRAACPNHKPTLPLQHEEKLVWTWLTRNILSAQHPSLWGQEL